MEKLYKKKNFGIPATILLILTYLIGYSLTQSLSGTLLVALLFAFAVFTFDFDDKVKNAVKHSYIFATIGKLLLLMFEIVNTISTVFMGGRITINSISDMFYGYGFFSRVLSFLFATGLLVVNVAIIVVFALCIIMALLDKEVNIGFVANILGEKPKKEENEQPTYNQNIPPVPPVGPHGQQDKINCPNCGKENSSNASFCGGCGNKLK